MRKLLLFGALGVVATPATAQRVWQPEIGVQAGFSSAKPAGTGADATTFIDLPGGTFLNALLTYAPLYAIIPAGRRLAVEPQFGASQFNLGSNAITIARIGLRFDYGFGSGFYGAAGGVLNYGSPGSPGTTQVGLQVGLGYHRHLVGTLNGRAEANWLTTHASDLAPAFNTYSLILGVSSSLGGAAPARSSRPVTAKAWAPVLGIQGGYASAHLVGSNNSLSGVFIPGFVSSSGLPVQVPPALFAIVPLSGKWAIEPSVDLHHTSEAGSSATSFEVGARVDYAVTGGWYAAAGGQLLNVNPAIGSSGTISGIALAWGYRFHLAGATGGRTELNYLMSRKNDSLGVPAINTLTLGIGLTMPLR